LLHSLGRRYSCIRPIITSGTAFLKHWKKVCSYTKHSHTVGELARRGSSSVDTRTKHVASNCYIRIPTRRLCQYSLCLGNGILSQLPTLKYESLRISSVCFGKSSVWKRLWLIKCVSCVFLRQELSIFLGFPSSIARQTAIARESNSLLSFSGQATRNAHKRCAEAIPLAIWLSGRSGHCVCKNSIKTFVTRAHTFQGPWYNS